MHERTNGRMHAQREMKGQLASVLPNYLNINSIKNKFNSLLSILSENMDVLSIAETKIDSSFSTSQFLIHNYRTP